jgi:hypothetical protein
MWKSKCKKPQTLAEGLNGPVVFGWERTQVKPSRLQIIFSLLGRIGVSSDLFGKFVPPTLLSYKCQPFKLVYGRAIVELLHCTRPPSTKRDDLGESSSCDGRRNRKTMSCFFEGLTYKPDFSNGAFGDRNDLGSGSARIIPMTNPQDDLQSARELRQMADLYIRRGAQGKAAELLDLAARIEARVNGQIQFA